VSTSLPEIGHVTTSQVDGLEIRSRRRQAHSTMWKVAKSLCSLSLGLRR
jgi:hypothetical protein